MYVVQPPQIHNSKFALWLHSTVEFPIRDTPNKGQPLKGMVHVPQKIHIPIVLIHFLPPKEDNLSGLNKVPFTWRFYCMVKHQYYNNVRGHEKTDL